MTNSNKIIELITLDKLRLNALTCVHTLNLPDCYIAAGFVRNLVWDYLHNKPLSTPLNDIDVIYYDLHENNKNKHAEYESQLKKLLPTVNWQVKNQAIMHLRNNDKQYTSSLNAMSYWPEKETAVAIRKLPNVGFECVSAFGFESLFNFQITHNPKRCITVFNERVKTKGWLSTWNKLYVV